MSNKKRAKKENEIAKTDDTSPKIHQRDKIDYQLAIRQRPDLTEKQKEFIETVLDKNTKVIFVAGPAGVAKTFLAVFCALQLLNQHKVSDLVYVRSIAESATKSLGSLPGEMESKMEPFLMPLYDKLEEFLCKGDIDRLVKEKRIRGIPVNYLRGASINAQCLILDEAQNLDRKELTTVLTRIGEFSKFIMVGDPSQSDINGKSGFQPMFDWFNVDSCKNAGIRCFSFTKKDVVRSGVLAFIVDHLENMPRT